MDGTIYTDGSMLDGPGGPFSRLGWSFVVLDCHGRVVASACGTPPTWISGIAGAEAWALLMAARHATPLATFRCDNKGVVDGLRRGAAWALGPERPQARVWSMLLTYFDNDEAVATVVWIPSHCNTRHVGHATLGNGDLLTAADVQGNGEADRLAKAAARWHRASQATRVQWKAAGVAAARLAALVGRATWAANRYDCAPKRDSAPCKRRAPGRKGRGGRTRPAPPEVRPPSWAATLSPRAPTGAGIARSADALLSCVLALRPGVALDPRRIAGLLRLRRASPREALQAEVTRALRAPASSGATFVALMGSRLRSGSPDPAQGRRVVLAKRSSCGA